jgi:hypothetical protein
MVDEKIGKVAEAEKQKRKRKRKEKNVEVFSTKFFIVTSFLFSTGYKRFLPFNVKNTFFYYFYYFNE